MTTSETEPTVDPSLDAYRFSDREWDGYERLIESFEWAVPEQFNATTYVCDRWAEADPDRVAIGENHEPTDELRAKLQAHVKDRLAKYEYPRALAFVDEFPKTTSCRLERCVGTISGNRRSSSTDQSIPLQRGNMIPHELDINERVIRGGRGLGGLWTDRQSGGQTL